MPKLNLCPLQNGYSFTLSEEAIATVLRGGKPRIRQDIIGAWKVVNVSWNLDMFKYDYFMAFYRSSINHGTLPFDIDLIVDNASLAEYTAQFIPGSISIPEISGGRRVITAQLFVKPLAIDSNFDESLVLMYELYGDQALNIINLLGITVNTYLPDALGA
jgi:hypothetical protein